MRLVIGLAALLLPLSGTPGQVGSRLVVPAAWATREGPTYTRVPFGKSQPVRLQQVYDGVLFPAGTHRVLTVAFRPDEAGVTSAGKQVDLELLGGVRPAGVLGLGTAFAANRPATLTTLFARKSLTLPAQTAATGPRPFTMGILLDKPLVYDRSGGGLFLEFIVHSQPGSGHTCDATYINPSARSDFGPPGCAGSNSKAPRATCATANVYWGEKLFLECADLLPHAAMVLLIGTRESGSWAGLPLPFSLTGLGAPGCWLSTDPVVFVPASADLTGRVSLPFTLPAAPGLMNLWIRFQVLAGDAGANGLGLVLSSGHKVQVSGPEPVARIYAYSLAATAGAHQLGVAAITEFGLQ